MAKASTSLESVKMDDFFIFEGCQNPETSVNRLIILDLPPPKKKVENEGL